jgi:hypothetical protein
MKTFALRSLQAVFIASAMTFLTGANGQGCGKVVVEDQPPVASPKPTPVDPPAPACPGGWHMDQVCAVASPAVGSAEPVNANGQADDPGCIAYDAPPAECHDECVPDSPCEAGFVQTQVCSQVEYGMPDCPPNGDCAAPPPPEPVCEYQCVPAQCPAGSHMEFTCEGGAAPGEPGESGSAGTGSGFAKPMRCEPSPDPQPMPAGPCSMSCVLDSMCPPGSIEQTTCSTCASENGGDCVAECFTECVPMGEPDQPVDAQPGGAAKR